MAEYLLLLYGEEAAGTTMSPEEMTTMMQGHQTFGQKNAAAIRGGNALEPSSMATSIRKDATGAFMVTDAPFAETKEALGGYYLVEASSLDGAIALAKQLPMPYGGVEVRPIHVFE